jgi:hypothetical protein
MADGGNSALRRTAFSSDAAKVSPGERITRHGGDYTKMTMPIIQQNQHLSGQHIVGFSTGRYFSGGPNKCTVYQHLSMNYPATD